MSMREYWALVGWLAMTLVIASVLMAPVILIINVFGTAWGGVAAVTMVLFAVPAAVMLLDSWGRR